MATRMRLDQELVDREMAKDLESARRMVMAGQVRIDGQFAVKPDQAVEDGADITVEGGPRYVSRGGEKLAGALAAFPIDVIDAICADVGASTGGFTDCLLQAGAARVYAIDVGRGQLHWKIRNDPRVVVMERTDARDIGQLAEAVDLATVDVSFISLRLLLPTVAAWLSLGGNLVALVKPQFEASAKDVGRGGVVRREGVRQGVLRQVHEWMVASELAPLGLVPSPLLGAKGNQEFLLWARRGAAPVAVDRLLAGLPSRGSG